MPFRIVRNDITKMNTQAIVNTANEFVTVGPGCDSAIYNAAGYDELLKYRSENVGEVREGEAFVTPGFNLRAEYIIHAVSPEYKNGEENEEEKLRSCYRKSLQLALEHSIRSIAFPLIATGSFGYPKEEGMRIAVDEINAFLMRHDMLIYLVVFDDRTTTLGGNIYPDLEEYIDQNYVNAKREEEYGDSRQRRARNTLFGNASGEHSTKMSGLAFGKETKYSSSKEAGFPAPGAPSKSKKASKLSLREELCEDLHEDLEEESLAKVKEESFGESLYEAKEEALYETNADVFFEEEYEQKLRERIKHRSDTFSQYLMYLIQDKNMENADVYKRAIVDKKTFSKIKNNVDYHPQKLTALCLCVGAKLNMDETKDLLARAGYALSPSDITDIIFSFFIENKIYDMIELDIQLEEHGLPCIIS